jgi:hypothetical protein
MASIRRSTGARARPEGTPRSTRLGVLLLCTVVLVGAVYQAPATRRGAGIVEVPTLFGTVDPNGPPEQIRPAPVEPIPLYAAPGSSEVLARASRVEDLESREFGYEQLGALTYDGRRGWHLVRARVDTGWILGWLAPTQAGRFHPLDSLLLGHLTYLTDAWDGRVFRDPGAEREATRLAPAPMGTRRHLIVRRITRRRDVPWLEVEVYTSWWCITPGDPPPVLMARGWIPAHADNGQPNAWFYARGC